MELFERKIDLVEVEESKEVEMEIIHLVRPIEIGIEDLGFNIRIDESDRTAFYTYHHKELSIGISIEKNTKDEYSYHFYAHIYGKANTDYDELCAAELTMLRKVKDLFNNHKDK